MAWRNLQQSAGEAGYNFVYFNLLSIAVFKQMFVHACVTNNHINLTSWLMRVEFLVISSELPFWSMVCTLWVNLLGVTTSLKGSIFQTCNIGARILHQADPMLSKEVGSLALITQLRFKSNVIMYENGDPHCCQWLWELQFLCPLTLVSCQKNKLTFTLGKAI